MIVNRSTYVAPLHIKQVNGSINHPYHPSVVYVEDGFAGHKWWMAQTPFPPFDAMEPYVDRYELPCIHYSDDGMTWYSVNTNPIDDLTQEEIAKKEYFSDPHLIINGDCLELYYRFTILKDGSLIGNKTILYRRKSMDGIHWSEREIVADLRREEDEAIWGEQIISQAVLIQDGKYYCWYVDASHHFLERGVRMTTSEDGIHWKRYKQCAFIGDDILKPWHIDVQYYQGRYQMMMYDVDENLLSWYQSEDCIKWKKKGDLLRPSQKRGDFYEDSLYRACSVYNGNTMRVYFSANNKLRSSIGMLETKDGVTFELINGNVGRLYTMQNQWQLFRAEMHDWYKMWKRRIKKICKI